MTESIALPSMRDLERLERRIEKLEDMVKKFAFLAVKNGDMSPNEVQTVFLVEDWHGKAKGSE